MERYATNIAPSIYGEIGPGTRIALSKLAIETYEQKLRPMRIAIDVLIWQFQTQAGQGGTNPAIRTFYYRLLRLLSVSVQPLFVFDGPHKPKFKRNKRVGQGGAMVPNLLTKQLLTLFGFPFHTAPGEAEAECALLQREGIVDAVLSEDVDTLMFGCGTTLRNWSSEGARGNKSPTHVNLYDATATKEGKAGLDREGMILIALMSGGDYITEGIPGCGIKIACEAARAGYGKRLCQIPRSDVEAYSQWRNDLVHEIHTNESKHFRMKHKALNIPEDFPNKEVLALYTHPVVSSASKVEKLKEELVWDGNINVEGLRIFVADAFDWTHKIGAIKFIRGLAPVMLVQKLRVRADRRASGYGDVVLTAINEMEYVRSICGQRTHFSTDGITELRVVYHPNEIVGLDLDAELDDSEDVGRDGLAPMNDDDQIEGYAEEDNDGKRGPSQYDPTQLDRIWIPHTIAKVGIPLKVEDYEETLRAPTKTTKPKGPAKKAAGKRALAKSSMPHGSMDRFVQITKKKLAGTSISKESFPESELPPSFLAPSLDRPVISRRSTSPSAHSTIPQTSTNTVSLELPTTSKARATKTRSKSTKQAAPFANPWAISQSRVQGNSPPRITKPLKPLAKQHDPTSQISQPHRTVIDLYSSSPEQPRHGSPHQQASSSPLPSDPNGLISSIESNARNSDLPRTPRKHIHSPSPPPSLHGDDKAEEGEQDLPPLPSTVTRTRGGRSVDWIEPLISTPSTGENDKIHPPPRKRHSPGSASSFGSGSGQQYRTVSRGEERPNSISELSSPTVRVLQFGRGEEIDHTTPTRGSDVKEDYKTKISGDFEVPHLQTTKSSTPPPLSFPPQSPPPRSNLQSQPHHVIDLSSSPLQPTSTHQPTITTTSSLSPVPPSSSTSSSTLTTHALTNNPLTDRENKNNSKKKKILLLRPSIGGFQELDEEEWAVKNASTSLAGPGGAQLPGRGGKRGKVKKTLRISQVEVLDLTGV